MRGHRPGDKPRGGKHEREQEHFPVRLPADRLRGGMNVLDRAHGLRQQRVERQAEQEIERRPNQQRFAPAQRVIEHVVTGQLTVEAKPAISVMPVIGPRALWP
jgi:hypothetical protein